MEGRPAGTNGLPTSLHNSAIIVYNKKSLCIKPTYITHSTSDISTKEKEINKTAKTSKSIC